MSGRSSAISMNSKSRIFFTSFAGKDSCGVLAGCVTAVMGMAAVAAVVVITGGVSVAVNVGTPAKAAPAGSTPRPVYDKITSVFGGAVAGATQITCPIADGLGNPPIPLVPGPHALTVAGLGNTSISLMALGDMPNTVDGLGHTPYWATRPSGDGPGNTPIPLITWATRPYR